MEQSNSNQKNPPATTTRKSRGRPSAKFEFDDRLLKNYGTRTGMFFGTADPNKNHDGYARWSDYVTYDSEQLTLAKDQLTKSNFLKKQQLPVQQNDQNQRQKENHGKGKRKSFPNISNDLGFSKQFSAVKSPFALDGVSDIKPKQSQTNRRSTQKQILEMIGQEESNISKKQKKYVQVQKRSQEEQQKPKYSKNLRSTRNSNQNIKQEGKQEQVNFKYIKSRRDNQRQKKRVTINDKGKIKYPSDSISGQFDPILTESLKKGIEETDKKRNRQVVEQNQNQHQKEDEPMDIVQDVVPQVQNAEIKVEIQHVVPKKVDKKQKKSKKNQKEIRVIPSTSKQKKQKKNNKSIPKDNQKKSKQTKQKPVKKNSKIEKQKNKVRIDNQTNVLQVIAQKQSSNTDNRHYPQRFRTKPLKFWQKQKTQIRKGIVVGAASSNKMLEALGFVKTSKINSSHPSIYMNSIQIKINLKPRQQIESSGFVQQNFQFLRYENLNQLNISLETNVDGDKVQIILNDFEKTFIDNPVNIAEEQSFRIVNRDEENMTTIFLTIRSKLT